MPGPGGGSRGGGGGFRGGGGGGFHSGGGGGFRGGFGGGPRPRIGLREGRADFGAAGFTAREVIMAVVVAWEVCWGSFFCRSFWY